jgi:hypothetical protein
MKYTESSVVNEYLAYCKMKYSIQIKDNSQQLIMSNILLESYGVQRHFQQYFSYIVAVSFIGRGNRSTRKKPPACHKLLTNFITECGIEYTSPWAGLELTTLVVLGTNCIGSCKFNYHTITTTTLVFIRNCCWRSVARQDILTLLITSPFSSW